MQNPKTHLHYFHRGAARREIESRRSGKNIREKLPSKVGGKKERFEVRKVTERAIRANSTQYTAKETLQIKLIMFHYHYTKGPTIDKNKIPTWELLVAGRGADFCEIGTIELAPTLNWWIEALAEHRRLARWGSWAGPRGTVARWLLKIIDWFWQIDSWQIFSLQDCFTFTHFKNSSQLYHFSKH